MSYDFRIFALEEPNADLTAVLSARERSNGPSLFSTESKERSQIIANALRFKNPKFDWRPVAIGNMEAIEME